MRQQARPGPANLDAMNHRDEIVRLEQAIHGLKARLAGLEERSEPSLEPGEAKR